MRCEPLWLVSYHRVHMKIWSAWFMSSFSFYWSAQWTAAAEQEQRRKNAFHPFIEKNVYVFFLAWKKKFYDLIKEHLNVVFGWIFVLLKKWFSESVHPSISVFLSLFLFPLSLLLQPSANQVLLNKALPLELAHGLLSLSCFPLIHTDDNVILSKPSLDQKRWKN